ncbi:MAG: hypothetical protein HOJ88_09960, partial [Proteobacteria bacterium]|nr:hypothetical protein [Pseudomonadota bacterium]
MQSSTTVEDFSETSITSGQGNITRGGSTLTVLHIDDDNTGDPNNNGAAVAGTYENPHTTAAGANADPLDADVILI